jgi:adenylate cyclase
MGEPDHQRWFEALGRIGVGDGDSEELRLQKAVLTYSTVFIAAVATVWVGVYMSLGLEPAAAIPFGYQVISVIGLVVFWRTKRFTWLRNVQLSVMLVLPFLLQWTLGGFVGASAVALWALAAPMGAMMFGAASWPWFGGYFLLLSISGLLEPALTPAPIPPTVRVVFFVLNVGVTSFTVFMLLGYFLRQRDAARAALAEEHRQLGIEREKSERLLLNILPAPIAERLKEGEEVIADAAEVSVLFADLVGFTPLAGRLPPRQVVHLLNNVFTQFDELADRCGLEKIKTIGDSYMAVAGLPVPRADHAIAIAEMALAITQVMPLLNSKCGHDLQVRVGIDCGPAVAGVIGRRKFSFDLWGDTVNTASRMETHGPPNRIQVTERVVAQLSSRYDFECAGEIEVKGKGRMPTWYLLGPADREPSGEQRHLTATQPGPDTQ